MGVSLASEPVVQLLQDKVLFDPANIPALRAEFAETGMVRLKDFLSPAVRKMLLRATEIASFCLKNETAKTGSVFGTTWFVHETDPAIMSALFLFNRPELFQLVTDVTGITRPGNFLCRIHRTVPSPDQHIDWHDDKADGRILGLNVNLSREPFEGGLFQIKGPDGRVRGEVHFSEPGEAFLFRIGNGWKHRLTPLQSGVRTVAVGWFREGPDWQTTAREGFRSGTIVISEWMGQ
jgi:hypothetical protein